MNRSAYSFYIPSSDVDKHTSRILNVLQYTSERTIYI